MDNEHSENSLLVQISPSHLELSPSCKVVKTPYPGGRNFWTPAPIAPFVTLPILQRRSVKSCSHASMDQPGKLLGPLQLVHQVFVEFWVICEQFHHFLRTIVKIRANRQCPLACAIVTFLFNLEQPNQPYMNLLDVGITKICYLLKIPCV